MTQNASTGIPLHEGKTKEERNQSSFITNFDYQRLRNNSSDQNDKAQFTAIYNGHNYCFAIVIIQMILHNQKALIAIKQSSSFINKIYRKIAKKRNPVISFNEFKDFIPNFNYYQNEEDPLLFFQFIYDSTNNVFKTLFTTKCNSNDVDTQMNYIVIKFIPAIHSTYEIINRRMNHESENHPKLSIKQYPEILLLVLDRTKNDNELDYSQIKINKYLKINDQTCYQLNSFILKTGNVNGGHFMICINLQGTYFLFNDNQITIKDNNIAFYENHSILFCYSKIVNNPLVSNDKFLSIFITR